MVEHNVFVLVVLVGTGLGFFYEEAAEAVGTRREGCRYIPDFPAAVEELKGVPSLVELTHGCGGVTLQLEFEHVDIIFRLDNHVNTSIACAQLSVNMEAYKLEDDEHDVLEVHFLRSLDMVVGYAGEKTLKRLHEFLRPTVLDVKNEISKRHSVAPALKV